MLNKFAKKLRFFTKCSILYICFLKKRFTEAYLRNSVTNIRRLQSVSFFYISERQLFGACIAAV